MSRSVFMANLIAKLIPREFKRFEFLQKPSRAKWLEEKFFEGDDMVCVIKDSVIPVGAHIDDPDNIVMPSTVANHFIEKAGFIWIMDKCICRYGLSCKNFPIEYGCMFLGEAARGINPEMGHEAGKEEAKSFLAKCREAGLVQFLGRSKLDTIYHKIGPGNRLLTICSCCPCCCISRGIPHSPENIKKRFFKMPGIKIKVNENCIACGKCVDNCFMKAISIQGEISVIGENCMGCGRCVEICAQKAISVSVGNENYVNEIIEQLTRSVDVT